MYTKDNNTKITKGYLDIGLNDTMHDLIVNFIGACIFCPLGYLYMINNKKYKLIESLMIKKTK